MVNLDNILHRLPETQSSYKTFSHYSQRLETVNGDFQRALNRAESHSDPVQNPIFSGLKCSDTSMLLVHFYLAQACRF